MGTILLLWILFHNVMMITSNECKTPKTDGPEFAPDMYKQIPMSADRGGRIKCCLFGVEKILWYFRQKRKKTFIYLKSSKYYTISNQNRTLFVNYPSARTSNGIFMCKGFAGNKTINGTTVVTTTKTKSELFIEIIGNSPIHMKLTERTRNGVVLYCIAKVFAGYTSQFKWHKKVNQATWTSVIDTYLTGRNYSKFVSSFHGFGELKLVRLLKNSFKEVNFTLHFDDGSLNEDSLYKCTISYKGDLKERTFNIYFLVDITIYMAIFGSIVGFISVVCVLVYMFQYDIKLFAKNCFRIFMEPKFSDSSYNFVFIYNFQDEKEFQDIHTVISNIERKGFVAYFYERDQNYGGDILEEMSMAMQNSDVAVIWTSPSIWKNPTFVFCIQMLINCFSHKKRLYVISPSKAKVKESCNSRIVQSDLSPCYSSRRYLWPGHRTFDQNRNLLCSSDNKKLGEGSNKICSTKDNLNRSSNDRKSIQLSHKKNYDVTNSYTDHIKGSKQILTNWHWHQFIGWLISSLPLHAQPIPRRSEYSSTVDCKN